MGVISSCRNVYGFISVTETSRYLHLTRSIQLDVTSLWKIYLSHTARIDLYQSIYSTRQVYPGLENGVLSWDRWTGSKGTKSTQKPLRTSYSIWRCIMIELMHYNDVIMGAMSSQITSLALFIQWFIQAQTKENFKAPRHWPLCGEFTSDRWIPRTNGQ